MKSVKNHSASRAVKFFTFLSIAIVALAGIARIGLGQTIGSIHTFDAFAGIKNSPTKVSGAMNILVVGSDSREGLTKAQEKLLQVGSTQSAAGARSDTMFLVHISKDRTNAVLISLPRDTMVTVPAHKSDVGNLQVPATKAKLNAAFAWGGAPLLIETIQQITNLHIDHYMEVNFTGFVGIVDALGGIQVCNRTAINDPGSHLVLPAGVHTLDGIQSLEYVRTRDFDGLGDIGRMKRQQQFVASVLRKATSAGVLLNPSKLISFTSAALSTLKMDQGFNQSDLLDLGESLSKLSTSGVRTLTVPLSNANAMDPVLGSVVIWDPVQATELFNRLRNDQPIYNTATPSPTATTKGSATPAPTATDQFGAQSAAINPCASFK